MDRSSPLIVDKDVAIDPVIRKRKKKNREKRCMCGWTLNGDQLER